MKKRQTMKFIYLCMALVLLAGVSRAEEQSVKTFTAVPGADGIQKVDILAGDYFFDPNLIIVKVNQPVELSIKKEGRIVPHVIAMKSPEAGMEFEESISREPKTIKFTPTKTGKYPFSCTKKPPFLKSHADRGMKGTIEVVE